MPPNYPPPMIINSPLEPQSPRDCIPHASNPLCSSYSQSALAKMSPFAEPLCVGYNTVSICFVAICFFTETRNTQTSMVRFRDSQTHANGSMEDEGVPGNRRGKWKGHCRGKNRLSTARISELKSEHNASPGVRSRSARSSKLPTVAMGERREETPKVNRNLESQGEGLGGQ